MNKKGGALDIFFIMLMIFVFALITIVGLTFYDKYTEAIDDNEAFNNSWNNQIEVDSRNALLSFDRIMPLLLIGLVILVIISSFYIKTHPLFFFVSLILLILAVVIAAILANIYTDITDASPDFQSAAANYTIISWVMDHLPSVILLIGGILLVILYAKSQFGDGV